MLRFAIDGIEDTEVPQKGKPIPDSPRYELNRVTGGLAVEAVEEAGPFLTDTELPAVTEWALPVMVLADLLELDGLADEIYDPNGRTDLGDQVLWNHRGRGTGGC